ncbi:type I polyketide synthase [Shewanella surugensis]|uniref:Phosphopantetheine-binding protein n=1 Tax=Shewanella surugensis TaxID=212020 RepID=A0ABT0L737_9GAMM|nr:type I polyketide synthase [Shewanella surugensis]MCL1123491.1 phosphopantetheine-binding protein [Shewanella surugensis]
MSSNKNNVPNEDQLDPRFNKRLKDNPIAIIGMASLFAHSRYLDQFWDLISDKIDGITDIPESHWQAQDYFDPNKSTPDKTYCKRGGFLPEVDFNPMEFGLPPNILELTDTSQLLSLLVAKDVLADANLTDCANKDRIGITLGVGGGQKISHSLAARLQYPMLKKVFKHSGINDKDSEMLIKKFQDQYVHWEENSFPGSLGNVIAGRIANRFDLGGMNCVVDAACAGSLAAMRMAISELVDGRSDVMITGGVCTDNSPYMYMSFSKTPAFTTQEVIQPFDIDSKGMMIGEGIGMVALKRLDDAKRDGDKIYAVIKGVGSSSDGKFKSIYAPRPEGQAKALKRAYDDAGFAPQTLGLIEAHGTGTAAGDMAEFNGLKSVFSEHCDKKQHIALGSVKSQIGHTKSTAGTAGLIKAALALHHKVLPATINVSQPNPKLNIEDSPFYLNTQTRPWLPRVDGTPRRAGISSFGFGGTNFHFVLEEYQAEHGRLKGASTAASSAADTDRVTNAQGYRQRQVPQTFLLSRVNKAELLTLLKQTLQAAKQTDSNINYLAQQSPLKALDATHPRLGLVASTINELTEKLNQAITELENGDEKHWKLASGVTFRVSALIETTTQASKNKPKVAALFAGQGAQYVNMGIELSCHFPEMRQQFALADKVFAQHDLSPVSQHVYPIPLFAKNAAKAQAAQLTQTLYAQSAIGALSMGQYQLFTEAGFDADMVAGHSFGELSALCAAGVVKLEDYYQLAFARGHAMSQVPEGVDAGSMAAVITKQADDLPQIKTCLLETEGVKIANYNSPTQFVIAGPSEALAQASSKLKDQGFKVIELPVSGAFHTPLVAHAQAPFAKAIDNVSFTKPKRTLYSNSTAKTYANNANSVKASFKQHMLQSVHFSQQIEAMYQAGARVFVEFGPKNILQKLVLDTLADKHHELCVVSINPNVSFNDKQNSEQQLRQAAIELAVTGIPLNKLDPYQAPTRIPEKVTPMTVKLSATNHISKATQTKMAQSLTSGTLSPQIQVQEKIIEKTKVVEVIVEVEKIVEKIVEAEKPVTPVDNIIDKRIESPTQPTMPASPEQHINSSASESSLTVPNDNSALSQFFAAQQQTAQLHQQFLTIPQQYNDTVTNMMTEQTKMANAGVSIPTALEQSMAQFHQHQADTLKNHAQYLTLQSQSNTAVLNLISQASSPFSSNATAAQTTLETIAETIAPPRMQAPIVDYPVTEQATTNVTVSQASSTPRQNSTQLQSSAITSLSPTNVQPALSVQDKKAADSAQQTQATLNVQTCMLEVVSEKTGYPTEMLSLEMDMEADLGIDSIKRVEILGSVQDKLPNLPELNPDDLAECRTLGEITTYLESQSLQIPASQGSSAHTSVSDATSADVQACMLAVVSEKTGYPTEMLSLEMDMEADLGIDSIKRVEILGSVQDKLPNLSELNPDDLAECRTLGEITTYLESQSLNNQSSDSQSLDNQGLQIPASQGSSAHTSVSDATSADVQACMLAVVSEKTGYPTEMLSLEMDMEADLGIDSIKRVEILGSVQDKLPNLPELNPDDLAECRTLGEITTYLESQSLNNQSSDSQSLDNQSLQIPASQGSSADTSADVQACMLAVVSEKTGYPTEMLSLEMDMEADLGIDSIKRVEILGSVQDKLPNLPELNPDDLAECRTLGEITTYLESQSLQIPASQDPSAHANTPAASDNTNADIQACMLDVVSEKTGYPTEMLSLEMDMEADLGIDSIKRVEILGSVQDKLPNLPELNPDDLAECRTLGEITAYLTSQSANTGIDTSTNVSGATLAIDQPETNTPKLSLPPHNEISVKKLPAAAKPSSLSNAAAYGEKNPCIIVIDDGHNAGVLAEKIKQAGLDVAVITLPQGYPTSPLNAEINRFQVEALTEVGIKTVLSQILAKVSAVAGFIHLQPQTLDHNRQTDRPVLLDDESLLHVKHAFLWAKLLQPHLFIEANDGNPHAIHLPRRSFITVSRIDGSFGYASSAQIKTAELNQGALAGLTKTLSHEWPNTFCRALDIAPQLDAKALSTAIINELFNPDNLAIEIGIDHQGRSQLVPTTSVSTLTQKNARISPQNKINNTDKILVTGGAKGVTLACALSLAKSTQAHFILAGRSEHISLSKRPEWALNTGTNELKAAAIAHIMSQGDKPTPKQIDALIWPIQSSLMIDEALVNFKALGASAEYLCMDVSAEKSVALNLNNITSVTDITGIIHGAGVLADKHIQDKNLDEFDRVYSTKVGGLQSILNTLDFSKLKLLALFSSAAGFYGNAGQSDYSMSNEILNKAALQFSQRNPHTHIMSFNWGPWDGGMVSPALKKMFTDRGVYVIPLDAGAALFSKILLDEDAISAHSVQLLVGSSMQGTSKENQVVNHLSGGDDVENHVNIGNINNINNEKSLQIKKPNASDAILSQHSLSDIAVINKIQSNKQHIQTELRTMPKLNSAITLTQDLSVANIPFIQDHRIAGNPVLPTVCAIQWMKQAALAVLTEESDHKENKYTTPLTTAPLHIVVKDYKLLKGVIFDTAYAKELSLCLTPVIRDNDDEQNEIIAVISCDDRPQYSARLLLHRISDGVSDCLDNKGMIDNDLTDKALANNNDDFINTESKASHFASIPGYVLYQNGSLFHGPRLQGIEKITHFDSDGLKALCKLPVIQNKECGPFTPSNKLGGSQPFAEDCLLQAMLVWARLKYDAASLPSSIGEFITYSPLLAEERGHITLEVIKSTKRLLIANVVLYHQDGQISAMMKEAKITISKGLNAAFTNIEHQRVES